jgi:predicted DNA-binding transcriptional regulator AlpA
MTAPTITTPPRFITRDEVLQRVGVSYACLWNWIRLGKFPEAVEMVGNSRRDRIGWLAHEVDDWFATRPRRRPKGSNRSAA